MMRWLVTVMTWTRALLTRRRKAITATEPIAGIAEIPPPQPEVVTISRNRHERRALERQRRKHDKFVTPKGERPTRSTGASRPKPPKKTEVIADIADDDADLFIADKHHEEPEGVDVLYREAEIYGEFNFRDTILEQLERYFVYIHRMRQIDYEAYALYRQIGATLLPYLATNSFDRRHEPMTEEDRRHVTPLSDWFNLTRPTFGCYAYGADITTEKYEQAHSTKRRGMYVPKFMYFRKYKRAPPNVQAIHDGDVYVMTVYWDKPYDRRFKHGTPQDFALGVSRDGDVRLLRMLDTKPVEIRSRRGRWVRIPQYRWRVPDVFEHWAQSERDSVDHMLTELFRQSTRSHERSQYAMVRIAATKGDTTAVFSVNERRMAYFFQDRDVTLNDKGSRRRIFHIVRAHTRNDGTAVRFHFRGEREFEWAGYRIKITVPGRDHFHIADFNVGAVDSAWLVDGEKYQSSGQLGAFLTKQVNSRRGALR